MSKLFTTILPSLLVGGLLFGSTFTGAQPAPPTPPTAPTPPKPPKPPKIKGQVHIDLSDLDDLVDEQIQNALEAVSDNDQIPPHMREALKQRLEKARVKLKKQLSKIDVNDMDALKTGLGQIGEELGQEMEQFGKEMEKWSKDFEKKMEKQVEAQVKQHKKLIFKGPMVDPWKGSGASIIMNDDPDDDLPGVDPDDDGDVDDAMNDMGAIKLDAKLKMDLKQLREQSDRKVKDAKQELDKAQERLQSLLENDGASEADISTAIDRVSSLEATIRKARIVAWVKARKMLDSDTRKKIEHAAHK